MHAKANACKAHGKPCVHMHGTWNVYKMEWSQFVEGERNKKERKEKGKGREGKEEKKQKRERERERKESWCSDDRNSSDQEIKFVYSTRTMLQEIGILPTLVYFSP